MTKEDYEKLSNLIFQCTVKEAFPQYSDESYWNVCSIDRDPNTGEVTIEIDQG